MAISGITPGSIYATNSQPLQSMSQHKQNAHHSISMSDIDEPTWPRSPPASARTTSRRKYFDLSSRGGDTGVKTGAASALTAIRYSSTPSDAEANNPRASIS